MLTQEHQARDESHKAAKRQRENEARILSGLPGADEQESDLSELICPHINTEDVDDEDGDPAVPGGTYKIQGRWCHDCNTWLKGYPEPHDY